MIRPLIKWTFFRPVVFSISFISACATTSCISGVSIVGELNLYPSMMLNVGWSLMNALSASSGTSKPMVPSFLSSSLLMRSIR